MASIIEGAAEAEPMEWYPWVVFIHAAAILAFFIAHGVSMAVAFAIRGETDVQRVRAMLDLSQSSLGTAAIAAILLGLLSGIAAGFMGTHWDRLWIWISLGLLVVVGGLMTPMGTIPLSKMRSAAGLPTRNGPGAEDLDQLRTLIAAWNPVPLATLGLGGFVAMLWLMMAQPF